MRTAYFDLVGGAAGDMLLAALIDAGASAEALREGLSGLGLGFELRLERVERRGLRAQRVEVVPGAEEGHHHRHLPEVLAIIAGAGLPSRAAQRAEAVFRALAAAEGAVHGVPPEQVHFHEVGAVDAIVDVCGVCLALELLEVDRVEASPLPLARGTVRAAHGTIPLPAPAVLRLVEQAQVPVEGRSGGSELVTPTGAAILTALAERFGEYPAMRVEASGQGAGRRVAPEDAPPNLTRVVLGRPAEGAPAEVVQLETNLDDQTGEATGYLCQRLLEAGALDVWVTPVQMKKGRPGAVVALLAEPSRADALTTLLLNESSALGVRRSRRQRTVLERRQVDVETPWGPVAVKLALRPDGRETRAPEYEACATLARRAGVPLQEVFQAALAGAISKG